VTLPLELAELTIDVQGIPCQQGSMIARVVRGRAYVVPDNDATLKAWRKAVVSAAHARATLEHWATADGPLAVEVEFYLPRPAAAAKRKRPHVRPDLDKLTRAIFDACTDAKVWADDARVVTLLARKFYAAEQPGARITIRSIA
jgi:Holliday junction resolvase RusA-like endonuclease